jgi:hypothetical protein
MNNAKRIIGYWTGANIRGCAAAVRAALASAAEAEQRASAALGTAAREVAAPWIGRPAGENIGAAASRLSGHLDATSGNIATANRSVERAAEIEAEIGRARRDQGANGARLALGVAARLVALSHEIRNGQHAHVLRDLCDLAERLPSPATDEPRADRALSEVSTMAAALDAEQPR